MNTNYCSEKGLGEKDTDYAPAKTKPICRAGLEKGTFCFLSHPSASWGLPLPPGPTAHEKRRAMECSRTPTLPRRPFQFLRVTGRIQSSGFDVNAGEGGALYKGRDLRLHAARVACYQVRHVYASVDGTRLETVRFKVVRWCRIEALKTW